MKFFSVLFTVIFLVSSTIDAQDDTLYFWKGGIVINKQSVNESEVDSITFYAPITNSRLNLKAFPEYGGDVSGSGVYIPGNEFTISAAANPNYVFVKWTGDTAYLADPNATSTTIIVPYYEISLTANFEKAGELVYGEFSDSRDGNLYKTIQIGTQVWMAENLRYLPSVVGPATGSESTPFYYVYDYDGTDVADAIQTANYDTYGVLYNWPAAMNEEPSSQVNPSGVQGVCPDGWHLPSDLEYISLEYYLAYNGYNFDGSIKGGARLKIAKSLASRSGWESSSIEGAVGNTDFPKYINKSGFTALPGGLRDPRGTFNSIGQGACWWSSDGRPTYGSFFRFLNSGSSGVGRTVLSNGHGVSVRCVKNIEVPKPTFYTLKLGVSPDGSGDLSGVGLYEAGTEISITAIPNAFYVFVNWTGDTEYILDADAAKTIVIMPDYEISLIANFEKVEMGEFIDNRDDNVYKTIQIGKQVWMAENLRYLPSVVGPETGSQITPYYYVYDYDGTDVVDAISTTNYYTYGVLYNWPAAMNEEASSTNIPSGLQGVCPDGWHLPSDAEWAELEKYLSDNGYRYDGIAGGERSKIGKSLASSSIWERSSNEGAIGNTDFSEYINKSGFTALPGGYRLAIDSFGTIGFNGYWWCATQINSDLAWHRFMINDYGHLFKGSQGKILGLSVRCVKNIPTEAEFETEQ